MDNETFTLRQASQILGVPAQTLRRFCNAGLVRRVKRMRAGYRILNNAQFELMHRLVYLRRCGLDMADLKTYVKLEERGDTTIGERKAMLETKRRQIWQMLQDGQENIDFIERQIELFDQKIK